jgi:tRNA threonylcarbamoyladenosine biosynthesis protein TsaB
MTTALALDTTTPAGSVALVEDDRVREERRGDPSRTHAERLPREILTVLEARGMSVPDVDLFAVAAGPGSFTGLRIGIATIQGFAFVHRRPVVGVSALDALACAAAADAAAGTIVAAWMDAHRREVFSALYRVTAAAPFALDRLVEIEAAAVGDPAATLARWAARGFAAPALFAGEGAWRYEEAIRRSGAAGAAIAPPAPIAGTIGRLALARARAGGAVDPAGIRPLYVRRPDAEIARENAPPQRTPR